MARLIGNETKYVQEVLSHEFRASKSGFMVARLERAFAEKLGMAHAIALCNGTATLHAILGALDIGVGDEVIVPALTMASTSLAVLHAGATPVWADVDRDSWCIDTESVEKLINERTRAVIAVALYGMPPDLDRLVSLCRSRNIVLVEDDAQCVFGTYGKRLAGTFGKASSFSFQSSKTLTAGEGGIIVTDDAKLAERIRSFSCLGYKPGVKREDIQSPQASRHFSIGWNYRMSDLQAAVALAQLEDAEFHVNSRQNAAFAMSQDCRWLVKQSATYECKSANWALAYRMENAPVSWEQFRNRFIAFGGDPFYACWLPNYQEPVFKDYDAEYCPVAESIQPNIVAFKTNYDLFDEAVEQDRILTKTIDDCVRGLVKEFPSEESSHERREALRRKYEDMGI
jgi:perosamine synthetase